MSEQIEATELRAIADEMRKLAQRIESARPAEDVQFIAGKLCCRVSKARWGMRLCDITTDEDKVRGIITTIERRGADSEDELLPENRLHRAERILAELRDGTFADDAAKELRSLADELSPASAAPTDNAHATTPANGKPSDDTVNQLVAKWFIEHLKEAKETLSRWTKATKRNAPFNDRAIAAGINLPGITRHRIGQSAAFNEFWDGIENRRELPRWMRMNESGEGGL